MGSTPNHPFWLWVLGLAVQDGPYSVLSKYFPQPVHSTSGVDLVSVAHYQFSAAALGGNSVCLLPALDWHGLAKDGWVGPPPRFVFHHGTHVWSTSEWPFILAIVLFLVGLVGIVLLRRRGPLRHFFF